MEILLASLPFLVSALLAGVMGFAIQRGATCTVAAVDEVLTRRRCRRLIAMVEASVWVLAGLLVARALDWHPPMPPGFPVGAITVLGGALLGLGAWVNGACVFGAIARLGNGEWAFAVTPLGFYAGSLLAPAFASLPAARLPHASPVLDLPGPAVLLLVTLLLARVAVPLLRAATNDVRQVVRRTWSPHGATSVIGIAFVLMFLLVGAWAYTDALADLARGRAMNLAARLALLGALFGGAFAGGLTAGRFAPSWGSAGRWAKCLAGGALMGAGSLLIPGSNDGLILVGMPLLWPYAWVAFATMCVTIAAAMMAAARGCAARDDGVAAAAPGP